MGSPRQSDRRSGDRDSPWAAWWFIGVGLGLLSVVLLLVVPRDSAVWAGIFWVTTAAALIAFLAATLALPAGVRGVWWWLLAFMALSTAAAALNDILRVGAGSTSPDAVDWLFVLAYVPALLALGILIRDRYPDRNGEAWIDALILSVAAATLVGAFLIAPVVSGSSPESGPATIFLIVFPTLDVVVLCGLIWLVLSSTRPNPSLTVLVCAFAVCLAGGLLRDATLASGLDGGAALAVEALHILGMVLLAAAVSAPGAARIGAPEAAAAGKVTRTRIVSMAVGVILVPLLIAFREAFGPSAVTEVLSLAAVVIIALTLWRVWLLVRELNEQRVVSRMFLDSAADGLVGLDNAGLVVFANLSSRKMLHCRESDLVGRNFHETVHAHASDGQPFLESRCPIQDLVRRRQAGAVSGDVLMRRDGTSFPADFTISPLIRSGESVGSVLSFRDATARLSMAKTQREFVSVVSHELRTPLTSIEGSLKLLDAGVVGPMNGEQRELLAIALNNSDRLGRLVNDILDLERLDSGQLSMQPQVIPAIAIAEQAVVSVSGAAVAADVTVRLECQPNTESAAVDVDSHRMVQVLVNLLGNAVKFSQRGAVVTVEVSASESDVRISVTDQGRGIPADQLNSIFDRFAQVEAGDARRNSGTGLGLAIARELVERSGGIIEVTSVHGEGSTFTVVLPISRGGVLVS